MSKIDELEIRISNIEARIASLQTAPRAAAGPGAKPIEANIDDPKWGDPEIRYVPKKWDGPSYLGERMSACSVEFLRFLAGELESSAAWKEGQGDETKAKYAIMDRRDAAKARAWARRKLEKGEGPPADFGDEETPF